MARDNGTAVAFADYETPFADEVTQPELALHKDTQLIPARYDSEFESPFSLTYETDGNTLNQPRAEAFVEMLAELHDAEFSESLHAIANEIEETILSKFDNSTLTNDQYSRYVKERTQSYLAPLYNEVDSMIDRVNSFLTENENVSDPGIDQFMDELHFDHNGELTPAQEQFFGKVLSKVKKVASKVKSVAEKFSPIHIALNKIKGLIRPLLTKVLNSLIGKIPKDLQPIAQTLAKKFLSHETRIEDPELAQDGEMLAGADFDGIQREFDLHISNLVFETNEFESAELINSYLYENEVEKSSSTELSLNDARQQFIQRLKDGEDVAPAMEQFVPAVMGAVKIAISIIGRKRVVDFLAGLLAKLVQKWVPPQTAKPLATSIVDLGLKSMSFEDVERDQEDLAYEAIANTVEEVVRTLSVEPELNSVNGLHDHEAIDRVTEHALPAFNKAAANNFPGHYLKRGVQTSRDPDVWVLMPRRRKDKLYKKYTKVFQATLTPPIASSLKTFGDITLAQFLKDTLGLNSTQAVEVRVHIYEAIPGTWLSKISMYERAPGLGSADKSAWVKIHPLTVAAATALLNEPGLGKDFGNSLMASHDKVAVGQRFYYLEVAGAPVRRPRIISRTHRHKRGQNGIQITARTSDIQAVLNFVRSEINVNYFFSEADANNIVEKLTKNDVIGVAEGIRKSLRDTLNKVLVSKASSKVKIIHESIPELYLSYVPETEQFAGAIGKIALQKVIEKLTERFVDAGYQAAKSFFKTRAAEFKDALTKPEDGITLRVSWAKVPGMAQIRSVIKLIRGEGSLGDLKNISLPTINAPTVTVTEGKNFL